MSKVYHELCDGQGNELLAYHSISGSDNEILNENRESQLVGSIDLDNAIGKTSCRKEPEHIAKAIHYDDVLMYMYTSGTTGCQTLSYHVI